MSNEELLTILKEHLARYPKMQPQDVVKLLYQNEFGPGHLVSDRTSCIERLEFLKDSYDMLKTEFSFRELNEYLTKYIAEGCPMVSHSEIYRQAYKPAYRVVKADRIRELCR